MDLIDILRTWKTIFSNMNYIFLAIIIALGFYIFNVLIFSFKTLIAVYHSFGLNKTVQFFVISAIGFKSVTMIHSYIGLIVTSILLGIFFSLIVYKIRVGLQNAKTGSGFLGWTGAVLALLVPGCAACGIGLVSILGIGGAFIYLLPYEGFELTLISISFLIIAILSLTKNIHVCSRLF